MLLRQQRARGAAQGGYPPPGALGCAQAAPFPRSSARIAVRAHSLPCWPLRSCPAAALALREGRLGLQRAWGAAAALAGAWGGWGAPGGPAAPAGGRGARRLRPPPLHGRVRLRAAHGMAALLRALCSAQLLAAAGARWQHMWCVTASLLGVSPRCWRAHWQRNPRRAVAPARGAANCGPPAASQAPRAPAGGRAEARTWTWSS